jgi:O-antigen ligase
LKSNNGYTTLNGVLFFLLGMSLPIKDQYSTIAIILCLAFSLFRCWKQKELKKQLKSTWFAVGVIGLLVLLRLLGLVYGDVEIAVKEFVRSLPLLLIPLVFSLNIFRDVEKPTFFGVLAGLFAIMIWCELHVVISMLENGEPISYFLKWPYLNFNFLGSLDLHPAYLGLFVVWTLYQVLYGKFTPSRYQYVIALLLTVFLFQLLARNALVIAFGLITVFVWTHKKTWLKLLYVSLIVGLLSIITFQQSYYLRNKIFYAFQGNNSISGDNRFERLEASLLVFNKAPFFGVGPGNDNELRKKEYLKEGEMLAYDLNYNAHNQFVEYLSTYGLLGGLIFIGIIVYFMYNLYQKKYWGYLFLWSAFIFSCLTESILERSMGIKYFALLVGLTIWQIEQQRKSENRNGLLSDHLE